MIRANLKIAFFPASAIADQYVSVSNAIAATVNQISLETGEVVAQYLLRLKNNP